MQCVLDAIWSVLLTPKIAIESPFTSRSGLRSVESKSHHQMTGRSCRKGSSTIRHDGEIAKLSGYMKGPHSEFLLRIILSGGIGVHDEQEHSIL